MKTIAALLFLTFTALAPTVLPAQDSSWSGQAELSAVSKSGNSDNQSFFGKGYLAWLLSENFKAKWSLKAARGEDDGERSSESFGTELRLDVQPKEPVYYFGFLSWFKDNFAGIDARYVLGLGGGYRLLDGPTNKLDLEAGPSFTREDSTDGSSNEYVAARAFGGYSYAFNEKNRFLQNLALLYDLEDSDNYGLNSETGVTAALNGNFSLKLSYTVEYDHRPVPATLARTDKTLSVALVADF